MKNKLSLLPYVHMLHCLKFTFQSLTMGKQVNTLYKISNKKKSSNFFKLLKWILSFTLIILSIYFVKDVWTKFEKKTTSFNTFRETLNELPTTVLCFSPFAKTSIFDGQEYDFALTLNEFIFLEEDDVADISNAENWQDFLKAAFYEIKRDFYLYIRSHSAL